MQEELAEKKNVKFKTPKQSVQDFLHFKNEITNKLQNTTDNNEKLALLEIYKQKKERNAR